MIGNLKEWVNNNVCFIDDKKYWSALKNIISPYSMWGENYNMNIKKEIQMYIESQNDHVLSNETIEFIKNDAYRTFYEFA